jgi:hypothetical protein
MSALLNPVHVISRHLGVGLLRRRYRIGSQDHLLSDAAVTGRGI